MNERGLERAEVDRGQKESLRQLLDEILPRNRFYAAKLAGIRTKEIESVADLARLPFTTKAELQKDQETSPPYGQVLTYPVAQYSRMHQTSGTNGKPLRWLDTPESWRRLLVCWRTIYQIVGVKSEDRLVFAFSFGPYLGFWTAFESAAMLGCLCLPGGGMSTVARLRFLLENQATVVLCTPTYALRMAEVAVQEGIELRASGVRALIVAGEPGGSIPATRARIESAWGARVFDHAGLTEIGVLAIECPENPGGMHVLESDYIAEVIDPQTGLSSPPGEIGELVVTNLCRWGSPVIRYRTGDLVQAETLCPCGSPFLRLKGGILGRADDMIHVRGNNVYPAALEGIIHRFHEVAEFRVEVDQSRHLTELNIEIEPISGHEGPSVADRIDQAIQAELLFRANVRIVPTGSLPRWDMKARRVSRK